MKYGYKVFTKEEEDFILKNRDKFTLKQIGEALNRTYSSIAHYNIKINNNFKYPQRYRPYIDVKCTFCNKTIKRREDIKTISGKHFCDNKCKNIYYSKSIEELNSWDKIISEMIKIFGKRCWLCSYDKIIEGHHIEEKFNGGKNKYYNCFLCCPNHHSEIHTGFIKSEEIKIIRDDKLSMIKKMEDSKISN